MTSNTIPLHGLTPALDLLADGGKDELEEVTTSSITEISEEDAQTKNILMLGSVDARHIIKTVTSKENAFKDITVRAFTGLMHLF